jgi:phosphoribosylaminoimidazole (AIR) synthetase
MYRKASTSYFGLYVDNSDIVNKQNINISGTQFIGMTSSGLESNSYAI